MLLDEGVETITAEELTTRLARLPENPRIVFSGNSALPRTALDIVDKALPRYILHALNAPRGLPDRDGVTWETAFVGPGMRGSKRLSFVPCRLSLVPDLYKTRMAPDAVILHCAPPRDGMLSLGIEVNVLPAAIEATRARGGRIVAVINPQMPYTFGDAQVPVHYADSIIEIDEELPSAKPHELSESAREIGSKVASMVPQGATMQLGIGSVPDGTLAALTSHKGLRVWTEMFSDGVLTLDREGCLDADHPIISSFCFGSRELYDWVDGNTAIRMLRTEKTNDPGLIAQQRAMTSVNTALQVDLFGQANASRINARIYSGFGGQTDFIVGAIHSPGGQAIMALRSWHPKANVSTIVPMISEPVTSFQPTVVVTEQGTAPLWGYDEHTQARHLIENAAHPDVRDDLAEEARALGIF